VTERLKYFGGANAPNDTNEFEHCISTSGYDENALRHIFSVAAAKIKMSRNSSADLLSRAETKYDRWLIDAKHANSLSDDLLISAFDNGLYDCDLKNLAFLQKTWQCLRQRRIVGLNLPTPIGLQR
jgi:hypothetical protein